MDTTTTELFITNRYDCYFHVTCPISLAHLKDCTLHADMDAMLKAVSDSTGEPIEDLVNCSIGVKFSYDTYEECDHRGFWKDIELEGATIEQWISDYEV
jgi:hypothetical protein